MDRVLELKFQLGVLAFGAGSALLFHWLDFSLGFWLLTFFAAVYAFVFFTPDPKKPIGD